MRLKCLKASIKLTRQQHTTINAITNSCFLLTRELKSLLCSEWEHQEHSQLSSHDRWCEKGWEDAAEDAINVYSNVGKCQSAVGECQCSVQSRLPGSVDGNALSRLSLPSSSQAEISTLRLLHLLPHQLRDEEHRGDLQDPDHLQPGDIWQEDQRLLRMSVRKVSPSESHLILPSLAPVRISPVISFRSNDSPV